MSADLTGAAPDQGPPPPVNRLDQTTGDEVNKNIKVWALISAAALALSVVLPWVSALGTDFSLMEGAGGPILLGAGVLAVALVALRAGRLPVRIYALAVAGLGL